MCVMKVGECGFFYYLNIGKEVVGICEVVVLVYFDSMVDDLKWECVDLKVVVWVKIVVMLDDVKVELCFVEMILVNNLWLLV